LAFVLWNPSAADAQLFSISGTVTDQGANPVAGVDLGLFDDLGNPIGIPPTATDSMGMYAISGLPAGTYGLLFEPSASTRLLVKLVEGVVVSGNTTLDVTLDPGNLLSGFVRDSTGVGIFNIDLDVKDRATGSDILTAGDNTDSTGFYDVVVPSGEFDLRWRAIDPTSLPWVTVEMRVDISADTTIDVTMVIGFFLSGIVSDAGANPILGANLDFIDAATGVKLDVLGDKSDSTGFYQVHLPGANYDIRVKTDPALKLLGAQIQSVPVFGDTAGVDFALQPGVLYQGSVKDPIGNAVFDADIDVTDVSTGDVVFTPFDKTDLLGLYQIVVPADLLDIDYQPPVITKLAPVRLAAVPVVNDTTVDVTVPNGALLSGSVMDGGAAAVAGVDIDVKISATGETVPILDDRTDMLGLFTTVVAPGVYDVEFEPSKALRLVAKRIPGLSVNQDTMLTCTLDTGWSVRGFVGDEAWSPFPEVTVSAFAQPGGIEIFTPGNKSDVAGSYEIILSPDTYSLVYAPDSTTGMADSTLANEFVFTDKVLNVQFPLSLATGIGGDDTPGIVGLVLLHQNYPNPFNPSTLIRYELPQAEQVMLRIYDVHGAFVTTLHEGYQERGTHEAVWNADDQRGKPVASGIYFYRLTTRSGELGRKMLLLK
jgi:hypothetical protein